MDFLQGNNMSAFNVFGNSKDVPSVVLAFATVNIVGYDPYGVSGFLRLGILFDTTSFGRAWISWIPSKNQ